MAGLPNGLRVLFKIHKPDSWLEDSVPWLIHDSSRTKLYVGKSLREGPKPLEQFSKYFHKAGFSVYMPYDNDSETSPLEIKTKDMEALSSSDVVVLELLETSLGVAQELGAARAFGKPVILITDSPRVIRHNWVRGDKGITTCRSKEDALQLLTARHGHNTLSLSTARP